MFLDFDNYIIDKVIKDLQKSVDDDIFYVLSVIPKRKRIICY
jgi:hypothetical protein